MKRVSYIAERLDKLIAESEEVLRTYNQPGNIDRHDLWFTEVKNFLSVNVPEYLEKLHSIAPKYRDQLLLEPYGRAAYNLTQEQLEVLKLVRGELSEASLPETVTGARVVTRTAHQPIRVFVSYSHKDRRHLDRLRTGLRGLKRQGLIEDWQDQDITPGNEWAEAIDENLKAADIILLLVSPDFVDSDYAYYKEMKRALERHERGEAVVIPVIVRPTDWEEEPFSKLEALPTKGRPIVKWPVRDDAWLDVAKGIRKAVKELAFKRQERAAKERYRKAVEQVWADKQISGTEAERLGNLTSEFGIDMDMDIATDIERDVMGDTKEAILDRQEQTAWEKERRERLDELYARARRLHQNQEWQAVVDVFEQLSAEDQDYPDPEGLLASAHEALKTAQEEEALRHYREEVESAWADGELDSGEVETLRDLADKLQLSPNHTGQIERGVIGDTKEAILESQERRAKEQYRKAVEEAWTEKHLSNADAEGLGTLASELSFSKDNAAEIERGVMGDTRQTILEHQEQVARQEERRKRLNQLYAQARTLHKNRKWQAVVNVFAQIHAEDPQYPDSKGLLKSARKALVKDWYDKGVDKYRMGDYKAAIRAYNKVIRLKPDHAQAWYKKGTALGNSGRYKEAIEAYDQAISLKPDYTEALRNRDIAWRNFTRSKGKL